MWQPLILYGSIKIDERSVSINCRRKKKSIKYSTENEKEAAINEISKFQEEVSLESERNQLYRVIDDNTVEIKVKDKLVKIDLDDLAKVREHIWSVSYNQISCVINGRRINLSRYILDCSNDIKVVHLNGDTSDNRRNNIRIDDAHDDNMDPKFRKTDITITGKEELSDYIRDGYINLPYEVLNSWFDRYNADDLINIFISESPKIEIDKNPNYSDHHLREECVLLQNYKSEIINNGIKSTTIAVRFLNYFMIDIMLQARRKSCPTIRQIWNSEKLRRFWELFMKRMKKDPVSRITNITLIQFFGTRYERVYNFPPSVAKSIYDLYGDSGNGRSVLDFCSGYGGRLLGFWFSKSFTSYTGIDPNTSIPYSDMIDWLQERYPTTKTVRMINKCAEDVNYTKIIGSNRVDLIFTSPPYFDIELYSEDQTQSYKRYPKYDEWLNKFLFKVIDMTTQYLSSNGRLIINIKDINKNDTVEQMIHFVTKDLKLKYETSIDFIQAKLPYDNVSGTGYEKFYVFTA